MSSETMRDMEEMCEKFFRLPEAEPGKVALYSEEKQKPNRLFSGTTYNTRGKKYWRDCLRLACPFPLDDSINEWPDNPQGLRSVIEKFTVETRGVGMEILRLLCEGMGLRPDYFEGDLSGGDVILNVNHCPPCPNPEKALGQAPHCDRNLIPSPPGISQWPRGRLQCQLWPAARGLHQRVAEEHRAPSDDLLG